MCCSIKVQPRPYIDRDVSWPHWAIAHLLLTAEGVAELCHQLALTPNASNHGT